MCPEVGRGYYPIMYKNTVLSDQSEGRTLVRVRSAREAELGVEMCMRELTDQGVKALIFPSEDLLRVWRLRLEALA